MAAGIFVVVVGAALLTAGLVVLSPSLSFTQRSEGVITRVRLDREDDGDEYRFALVRFRLTDGRELEAETTTNVGESDAVGKVVRVRYDPNDPSRMDLAGSPARIAGWALFGVGLLLGFIGLAILLASAR